MGSQWLGGNDVVGQYKKRFLTYIFVYMRIKKIQPSLLVNLKCLYNTQGFLVKRLNWICETDWGLLIFDYLSCDAKWELVKSTIGL